MRGAGLKALAVFLLLLVFLMGVSFEPCFARRRGKHWRTTRHSYFSSLVKKKAKWKGWTHHHYKKPFLSPPFLSPTPSPSPSPSHGFSHYPSPSPSPSHGFSHYPSPSSSPSRGFSHTPSPSHGHFHSPPPSSSPSHGFFHSPPPSSSPSHGYFHSPAPSSSPSHGFSHIPAPKPSPAPSPATHFGRENVFDVLAFGAKGDGVTDDTKAFMAAWASACKVEGSTVLVPADYEFLVGPISFSGPYCQPNIVFQLEGTIMAPTNSKAWGSGLLQWLEFSKLKGITITGRGTIEGRGAVWWSQSQPEYEPIAGSLFDTMPQTKPTALRFYGSVGVIVSGIAIQNSPQCHLKFDDCIGVQVFNLSISSPGNSLNTDGIHLQNSRDVSIHHVDLRCGDDCVSIQTGCSNVNIQSVSCGPGHGISIGGLGRGDTKACVSNITVQNVAMQGTMTGVRIKTWQGGSGSVQNIKFSGIRMTEVEMPIVIDQFYCDRTTCHNQTAAVALSGISYENIKGTYTVKPVHFACSDSLPCWDIRLANIELRPIQLRYKMFNPFCWQTFGELLSPAVPPIECLQTGKPATSRPMSELDAC